MKNQFTHLFPDKRFRELSLDEKRIWQRAYFKANKERHHKTLRRHKDKLLNEFFDHYGHACTCCGEADKRFLSIEHLLGGGNAHKRKLKRSSVDSTIRDIRNSGWPPIYTTLCFNCNFGKWRMGGTCPHVIEKAKGWLQEILAIQTEIDHATAQ